jgi:hypothetical protein
MTRSRLVGCVLVVLTCGALAACTTTHADRVRTGDPASSANSVSAIAAVPNEGDVHLTDYTDNDSMTSSVILTGAVGDHGSAIRDDSKGRLDLELSRGTFQLDTADLDARFLTLMRHLAVNQHSCSSEASASGRAPIVPGSGTGAYSTVSGAFDLTMTLDEVYHPGACQETAPYLAQQIVTTGWGNVSPS